MFALSWTFISSFCRSDGAVCNLSCNALAFHFSYFDFMPIPEIQEFALFAAIALFVLATFTLQSSNPERENNVE